MEWQVWKARLRAPPPSPRVKRTARDAPSRRAQFIEPGVEVCVQYGIAKNRKHLLDDGSPAPPPRCATCNARLVDPRNCCMKARNQKKEKETRAARAGRIAA